MSSRRASVSEVKLFHFAEVKLFHFAEGKLFHGAGVRLFHSVLVVAAFSGLVSACEEEGGPASGASSCLPVSTTSPSPSPATTPPAGIAGEFCDNTLGVIAAALESCC